MSKQLLNEVEAKRLYIVAFCLGMIMSNIKNKKTSLEAALECFEENYEAAKSKS